MPDREKHPVEIALQLVEEPSNAIPLAATGWVVLMVAHGQPVAGVFTPSLFQHPGFSLILGLIAVATIFCTLKLLLKVVGIIRANSRQRASQKESSPVPADSSTQPFKFEFPWYMHAWSFLTGTILLGWVSYMILTTISPQGHYDSPFEKVLLAASTAGAAAIVLMLLSGAIAMMWDPLVWLWRAVTKHSRGSD